MRLSTLLEALLPSSFDFNPEVKSLSLDSRTLKEGGLFIALKGTHLDARQFIPSALTKKPSAILIDDETESVEFSNDIPILSIADLRNKLGALAARFYDYPARQLQVIGVTGTSGKTSCTHYLADCLTRANIACPVIGTLGHGYVGKVSDVGLTTPDAITLHALFRDFVEHGAKALAMEVSSHSIAQGRINAIDYEVGIFTNLSQDHLDYHGDMETYAAVKYKFLASDHTKTLILNLDDQYAKHWLKELSQSKPIFTYSISSSIADVRVKHAKFTDQGIEAELITPWGEGKLGLPLLGQFNLSNALASIAALGTLQMPLADILSHIRKIKPVPGRMQMLGGKSQPLIVVDYAHKPDALEKVLQALRHHTQGKLICVFGCGGERDRGKRPIMAQIAERWADQIIVTNDNPRHEDPNAIADEIMQGFKDQKRILIELDRSKAIEKSIQWAEANDCILIAGKGAEHYQQIGDEKLPFDDVKVVTRFMS